MNLSFRNRIALVYMFATAVVMAIVFSIIYLVVHGTVIRQLDDDLTFEAKKHSTEIKINGDNIFFINKTEWEEKEHRETQVNPVFIQLMDNRGAIVDKSPNLKEDNLIFKGVEQGIHFDSKLNKRSIRQVQLPLEHNGTIKGFIIAAISSESSKSVLLTLRNALLLSYSIALIGLYFISRFLAGRSIMPIKEITNTITRITKNNLKERVSLPVNKDEIFDLSSNFNALLQRIENALEREKQFTSDASHELRTPLASLRGTLEVLVRKPRTQEEYEAKIHHSLAEIERMTATLEQLLLLARLDTDNDIDANVMISLATLIDESITRHKTEITNKNLKIELDVNNKEDAMVPSYYSNLIIDNLMSNAIKYSLSDNEIMIKTKLHNGSVICSIQDFGVGIKTEDIKHVFNNFFRSDALNHKQIKGNGLGLTIVKKSAHAIKAALEIKSDLNKGTTVTITF